MSAARKPARLDRFVDLILRRRWLTVALASAVMVLMSSGGSLHYHDERLPDDVQRGQPGVGRL